jgi:glycosyltransferase involved in cell wall biosynthesis
VGNSKVKLTIERPVTVITPTIGKPELKKAIESVKNQTYKCKHLVIIDGLEHARNVPGSDGDYLQVCYTPENTGANGYYGHRIYAAYPHLVNSDYVLFLDEDNWYEPNHVETLIETIEQKNLDFSYSLRKIFDKNENYLIDDNCESLGKWEIFMSRSSPHGKQYLVDTSSYCFKREFIQQACHLWHSGWGGDRRFFHIVKDQAKYDTNGLYSLCYRLDGNQGSVTKEFFESGNKTQEQYFGGNYPWKKT